MPHIASLYLVAATIVLGAIAIGGGVYETLLIDRAWPAKRDIIQPQHGGIRRALFWGPVHIMFELALVASLWATWSNPFQRDCVAAALGIHVITRAWSFAYFIPRALQFEKGIGDNAMAARWVRLSRWRLLPESFALFALVTSLVLAKVQ